MRYNYYYYKKRIQRGGSIMILKLKLSGQAENAIKTVRDIRFPQDTVTAGYIVGGAIDAVSQLADTEITAVLNQLHFSEPSGPGRSTSLSLRMESHSSLLALQQRLAALLDRKNLPLSRTIDLVTSIYVYRLCSVHETSAPEQVCQSPRIQSLQLIQTVAEILQEAEQAEPRAVEFASLLKNLIQEYTERRSL